MPQDFTPLFEDPYTATIDGQPAILTIRKLTAQHLIEELSSDEEVTYLRSYDPVRRMILTTALDIGGYACHVCGTPMDEATAKEPCSHCDQ